MMKEMIIDGRKKAVFLLEEGPSAFIVIPFDSINHTDYKRLKALSESGKNLMEAMLDTTLDNGKNCLQLYQHIIKVVYKNAQPAQILQGGTSKPAPVLDTQPAAAPQKRKPGRPAKAKPVAAAPAPAAATGGNNS